MESSPIQRLLVSRFESAPENNKCVYVRENVSKLAMRADSSGKGDEMCKKYRRTNAGKYYRRRLPASPNAEERGSSFPLRILVENSSNPTEPNFDSSLSQP